ncbi:UNKNOWN [Stylonychia lemnae]|uniref:Serine aminopeptidase S33 domain-containing protein n=1 Tax=Stylonychia lemnae TaxID=5949 RepID=A0A077ZSE9_STYLE|nr:UNKNOWN [Stylonychia lemnae]|eukprot:CDW72798.1 UNKNOWN [Stylonychia lemnae]
MELSVSGGYSQFWKAIIRPPRENYELKDLGPKELIIDGTRVRRTDLELTNPRGHNLKCSFFEIHESKRPEKELPCVIFLHGNCSSRKGSFDCLEYLLPQFIQLFTFDFSGCGMSEGDYISLGWHERDDLQCVIEYLRSSGKVSLIGLWGRSMGAATALLHGHRDPTIAGMVLDSPFSHLKQLAEELVSNNTKIPQFLTSMALKMVRSSIQSKANFDIFELNPIDHVDTCFIPALFLAGDQDDFVAPQHSKDIYEKYEGDKKLITFEGGHNGVRPDHVLQQVAEFFYLTMQCDAVQQRQTELKIKQQREVEELRQKLKKDEIKIKRFEQPLVIRNPSNPINDDDYQSNQLSKYNSEDFQLGIDEDEEFKLALIASIEQQKFEPSHRLN